MTFGKKVQVRRDRPSFPAFAMALLVTALVFYLATVSVKKEKALNTKSEAVRFTREVALSGDEYYYVLLYRGPSAEDARIACARYRARGAAGYLIREGDAFLCVGNAYESRSEAEKTAERITDGGTEAFAESAACAEVVLRVTADMETIEKTEFCWNAVIQAEKALFGISAQLDSGEIGEREAAALLSVASYDLEQARAFARRAKDAGAAEAVFGMYLKAADAARALTQYGAGGEMYLSARVKHAAIEMIELRHAVLNALSG